MKLSALRSTSKPSSWTVDSTPPRRGPASKSVKWQSGANSTSRCAAARPAMPPPTTAIRGEEGASVKESQIPRLCGRGRPYILAFAGLLSSERHAKPGIGTGLARKRGRTICRVTDSTRPTHNRKGVAMLVALLVVLLLLALFGLPVWPYAADWGVGYWPSGMLTLLLVVILVVALLNGGFGRRGPLV
jgi:hypothetical protein